jgi:hypothetical protein
MGVYLFGINLSLANIEEVAMPSNWHVCVNRVIEFSFTSALLHADPFNDLEVDVIS